MRTIIGHCTKIWDGLDKESRLWRAMERAMHVAYKEISEEDKRDVKRLLERIPVITDYAGNGEANANG